MTLSTQSGNILGIADVSSAIDSTEVIQRVSAQAQDVLESAETATNWLKRPNRALGGHAPIDLLDTDMGTEQVVELLDRIEYGVYS
jgi:putative toxin-antitoxin system antitoxin component (TIGR02293 family)